MQQNLPISLQCGLTRFPRRLDDSQDPVFVEGFFRAERVVVDLAVWQHKRRTGHGPPFFIPHTKSFPAILHDPSLIGSIVEVFRESIHIQTRFAGDLDQGVPQVNPPAFMIQGSSHAVVIVEGAERILGEGAFIRFGREGNGIRISLVVPWAEVAERLFLGRERDFLVDDVPGRWGAVDDVQRESPPVDDEWVLKFGENGFQPRRGDVRPGSLVLSINVDSGRVRHLLNLREGVWKEKYTMDAEAERAQIQSRPGVRGNPFRRPSEIRIEVCSLRGFPVRPCNANAPRPFKPNAGTAIRRVSENSSPY